MSKFTNEWTIRSAYPIAQLADRNACAADASQLAHRARRQMVGRLHQRRQRRLLRLVCEAAAAAVDAAGHRRACGELEIGLRVAGHHNLFAVLEVG